MGSYSGFLASAIDSHIASQDDANKRTSLPNPSQQLLKPLPFLANMTIPIVLQRHLVQITSPLLPRLRFQIPRPLLGLYQITLQHALQNPLHLFLGLHNLPHDNQIPTHVRSQSRHLPCAIPANRRLSSRHNLSLRIHTL